VALAEVCSLDLGPALALLQGCAVRVATDVDVPLLGPRGAARGFAPQKGASVEAVAEIEAALSHWAQLLGRSPDGKNPAHALGGGAGGGMGAALIRLGAQRVEGIRTVLEAGDVERLVPRVELVVTGEGRFDWQSLRGKVISGVAQLAAGSGVPTLVLAGEVDLSRREWMQLGVAGALPAAPQSGQTPEQGLRNAAERAARTWSASVVRGRGSPD
jgi:glycerate 2-kinase